MNHFLLDASALAKRYSREPGSEHIDRLFDQVPRRRLLCMMLGVAEVVSVLVRARNRGRLSDSTMRTGIATLWTEVVEQRRFRNLEIRNQLISAAVPFIPQHGVNSTDAALLRLLLDLLSQFRTRGDDLVLVASDQRLLRAAQAEGLVTFDPEVDDEARLDALIGV